MIQAFISYVLVLQGTSLYVHVQADETAILFALLPDNQAQVIVVQTDLKPVAEFQ